METNHRTFDAASVNGLKTVVGLAILPALQGCVRLCDVYEFAAHVSQV